MTGRHETIRAVLFDFGGVLAEEGFESGMRSIAESNGIPGESFLSAVEQTVYGIGYTTGEADNAGFWNAVRGMFRLREADAELNRAVLDRFRVRPWMLDTVGQIRKSGRRVGILSDQTDWLDELDRQNGLFRLFDNVMNSYHTGRTKKEPDTFDFAAAEMKTPPEAILFVDDNRPHTERAAAKGFHVIHYIGRERFFAEIGRALPDIRFPVSGQAPEP